MSDLWTIASSDDNEDNQQKLISTARIACAQHFGFIAEANSRDEYEDRLNLVADKVEATINRLVANDLSQFPLVHSAVLQSWDDDFSLLLAEKQRTAAAARRRQAKVKRKKATLHTAPGGGIHAPYDVKKRGDKWVVVNSLGEVKGTHPSEQAARQQQKALYRNVPGAREKAASRRTASDGLSGDEFKNARRRHSDHCTYNSNGVCVVCGDRKTASRRTAGEVDGYRYRVIWGWSSFEDFPTLGEAQDFANNLVFQQGDSSGGPFNETWPPVVVDKEQGYSTVASRRTAANSCRNCDKPISGGSAYCSATCEGMDKFPASRDDQEAMTGRNSMPSDAYVDWMNTQAGRRTAADSGFGFQCLECGAKFKNPKRKCSKCGSYDIDLDPNATSKSAALSVPSPWAEEPDDDFIVWQSKRYPGLFRVETPGHGGFFVPQRYTTVIPPKVLDWAAPSGNFRYNGGSWLEEDEAVYAAFAYLDGLASEYAEYSHGRVTQQYALDRLKEWGIIGGRNASLTKQAWNPTIPQIKNAQTPVPPSVGGRECNTDELKRQIGNMNIAAISGGRILPVFAGSLKVGISMPVSSGYSVNVLLDSNDTYIVQRILNGRVLGQQDNVYMDEVGEAAYQASSYKSNEFGGHSPRMGSRKVAFNWQPGDDEPGWSEQSEVAYVGNEWGDSLHVWFDPDREEWNWSYLQSGPNARYSNGGIASSKRDAKAKAEDTYRAAGGSLDLDGRVWKRNAGRKVAWTADGSDITPMAQRLMDMTDKATDTEAWNSDMEGYRLSVEKFLAERIAPFVNQITEADRDVLEDYNFHVTNRAIDRALGRTATRRTALASPEQRAELVSRLTDLFNSAFQMYVRTHGAHWNVTGPDFRQYHGLFEEIYSDVYGSIDTIAEWMRKLGATAPASVNQLPDDSLDGVGSTDAAILVSIVLAANEKVLGVLDGLFTLANNDGEQGLANFIAERIDQHERWTWFLSASIGKTANRKTANYTEYESGFYDGHDDGEAGLPNHCVHRTDDYGRGYIQGWTNVQIRKSPEHQRAMEEIHQHEFDSDHTAPWNWPRGTIASRRIAAEYSQEGNAPRLFSGDRTSGDFSLTQLESPDFYRQPETSTLGWAGKTGRVKTGGRTAGRSSTEDFYRDIVQRGEPWVSDCPNPFCRDGVHLECSGIQCDCPCHAFGFNEMSSFGRRRNASRRTAGDNPFAKKDKSDDQTDDQTDDQSDGKDQQPKDKQPQQPAPEQQDEQPAEGADPSQMTPGDNVSVSYTMSDGGAGDVDAVFVREENNVFFFNGPTGEFGVAEQNGQWQDAKGNTFVFASPSDGGKDDQETTKMKPKEEVTPADESQDDGASQDDGKDGKSDGPPWAKKSNRTAAMSDYLFNRTRDNSMCKECNGSGTVEDSQDWEKLAKCQSCKGTGFAGGTTPQWAKQSSVRRATAADYPTPIDVTSGSTVAWYSYDNMDDAQAASRAARANMDYDRHYAGMIGDIRQTSDGLFVVTVP